MTTSGTAVLAGDGPRQGSGYAIVDLETTGLRPDWHDRIVEVGVVLVSRAGEVTEEWTSLVNAERDLGPQGIHGISAADMRHAPTFAQVAPALARLLAGRIVVAHNLAFESMFLQAEFARNGLSVPIDQLGLCTMTLAAEYLPAAPRSLAGCCAVAGVPLNGQHAALADARAAAGLLRCYLTAAGRPEPWHDLFRTCAAWRWPALGPVRVECVHRGVAAQRDQHFLVRVVDKMPRVSDPPRADAYLALLDQALLDRHICAREADDLVAVAHHLGLDRAVLDRLHRGYLATLATVAWSDGILTDQERADLHSVATLLGLSSGDADQALHAIQTSPTVPSPATPLFRLRPGARVVFTGQMTEPRTVWEQRARTAGLVPHDSVTKQVHLVVAADPDSLSGKARKAHNYGIPIVTPTAFAQMLSQLATT